MTIAINPQLQEGGDDLFNQPITHFLLVHLCYVLYYYYYHNNNNNNRQPSQGPAYPWKPPSYHPSICHVRESEPLQGGMESEPWLLW